MWHNWITGFFLLFSGTDMAFNDCPTGCLAQSEVAARLGLQVAAIEFQEEIDGQELHLSYGLPRAYGPFQPTVAASLSDEGSLWVGAGVQWAYEFGRSGVIAEGSFLPGLQRDGGGPDLGNSIQFRGRIGIGYEFDNGNRIIVAYDHRSNADTDPVNPGLETISLRVSFALD